MRWIAVALAFAAVAHAKEKEQDPAAALRAKWPAVAKARFSVALAGSFGDPALDAALPAAVDEAMRRLGLAVAPAGSAAVRALSVEPEGDTAFALTLTAGRGPAVMATARSLHRSEPVAAAGHAPVAKPAALREAVARAVADALAAFRAGVARPVAYVTLRLAPAGLDPGQRTAARAVARCAAGLGALAPPISVDGDPERLAFPIRVERPGRAAVDDALTNIARRIAAEVGRAPARCPLDPKLAGRSPHATVDPGANSLVLAF